MEAPVNNLSGDRGRDGITMDMLDHYKAVKARLHAGRPPEPARPPEPDRSIDLGPLMREAHIIADAPVGPAWRHIIRHVLERHNISHAELIGKRRVKHIIAARQEAYWLLREQGYSLHQIGQRLGNRDHTTILSGVRAYAAKQTKPFDPISQAGDL